MCGGRLDARPQNGSSRSCREKEGGIPHPPMTSYSVGRRSYEEAGNHASQEGGRWTGGCGCADECQLLRRAGQRSESAVLRRCHQPVDQSRRSGCPTDLCGNLRQKPADKQYRTSEEDVRSSARIEGATDAWLAASEECRPSGTTDEWFDLHPIWSREDAVFPTNTNWSHRRDREITTAQGDPTCENRNGQAKNWPGTSISFIGTKRCFPR